MQLFLQRCAQKELFGVSHDATLRATVAAEVELDPTSATVARNVVRKVVSCVRAFRAHTAIYDGI